MYLASARTGFYPVKETDLGDKAVNPHMLEPADAGTILGGFVASFFVQTVAGTATKSLFGASGIAPWKGRVVRVSAVMTGIGAAGDTLQLKNATAVTDITDAADVSAQADKALYEGFLLDDAQWGFAAGDNLTVVQASDALAMVRVDCIRLA